MDDEMIVRAFRALSDPRRHHIVEFLSNMCCGAASLDEEGGVEGPTAGEICCHITGEEKINSTVSHHLHELEEAGLIGIERSGKRMLCALKTETLRELAEHLNSLAAGKGNCCC